MRRDLIFSRFSNSNVLTNIDNWNKYGQLTVWHLTNLGNWARLWSAKCAFFGLKKIRFMQNESVLQTKNRSEPAKNWFSVALIIYISMHMQNFIDICLFILKMLSKNAFGHESRAITVVSEWNYPTCNSIPLLSDTNVYAMHKQNFIDIPLFILTKNAFWT